MRKKGLGDMLIRLVMRPHNKAKTRVREDSELSEEFEVNVEMHQGCVLSPILFALMADVVTELARDSVLRESLYAEDLDMMSKTTVWSWNAFRKMKVTF